MIFDQKTLGLQMLLGVIIGFVLYFCWLDDILGFNKHEETFYDVTMVKEERIHNNYDRKVSGFKYIENNNETTFQRALSWGKYYPHRDDMIAAAVSFDRYPDYNPKGLKVDDENKNEFIIYLAKQGSGSVSKCFEFNKSTSHTSELQDYDGWKFSMMDMKSLLGSSRKNDNYTMIGTDVTSRVKEYGVANILKFNNISVCNAPTEAEKKEQEAKEKAEAFEAAEIDESDINSKIRYIVGDKQVDSLSIKELTNVFKTIRDEIGLYLFGTDDSEILAIGEASGNAKLYLLYQRKVGTGYKYRECYVANDFTIVGEKLYDYAFSHNQAHDKICSAILWSQTSVEHNTNLCYFVDRYQISVKRNKENYESRINTSNGSEESVNE